VRIPRGNSSKAVEISRDDSENVASMTGGIDAASGALNVLSYP
jgi:hypothetical protein